MLSHILPSLRPRGPQKLLPELVPPLGLCCCHHFHQWNLSGDKNVPLDIRECVMLCTNAAVMLLDVMPQIDRVALIHTVLQGCVWCIQDLGVCVVPKQKRFCRSRDPITSYRMRFGTFRRQSVVRNCLLFTFACGLTVIRCMMIKWMVAIWSLKSPGSWTLQW